MITHGLSPKVLAPAVAQLIVVIVLCALTGEFDRTELTITLTGLVSALLGVQASPGQVTSPRPGPASDDLTYAAKAAEKPNTFRTDLAKARGARPPKKAARKRTR